MTLVFAFMCVLCVFSDGLARSVDSEDEPIIAVVTGTLYALEPLTGQNEHTINRRHLDDVVSSGSQAMRLDLGPELVALEMELSQDSVWSQDSVVVERRGEQEQESHNLVDSNCFLSGLLTSQNGAVSLNRCGKLSGMVQTDEFYYSIEGSEGDGQDSEISNVKVTMRRSIRMTNDERDAIVNSVDLGREREEADEQIFNGTFSKRQNNPATAEIAVYLDANFAEYQHYRLQGIFGNRDTPANQITEWIIMKWNIIRGIYGNEAVVGVPFTLQLKKIEIWWNNPRFYGPVSRGRDTGAILSTFCKETADLPNYDHKMLYSKDTGGHQLGLANLNGICGRHGKCSVVKSKDDGVKIELHEFGHSVGLPHDPDLEPCTDPYGDGGFMGWGFNNRWLDCYTRKLLTSLRQPGKRCLYQVNVPNLPVLNPNQ